MVVGLGDPHFWLLTDGEQLGVISAWLRRRGMKVVPKEVLVCRLCRCPAAIGKESEGNGG